MKQVPVIADYGGICGEDPLWDRRSQSLYWTIAPGAASTATVGRLASMKSSASTGGTFRIIGAPWRFSRTPVEINRPPLKGEHAAEILKELGHTSDEIAEFELGQVA